MPAGAESPAHSSGCLGGGATGARMEETAVERMHHHTRESGAPSLLTPVPLHRLPLFLTHTHCQTHTHTHTMGSYKCDTGAVPCPGVVW